MAGEVKVSLMTYLDTVPDDAKIYVVKPGDTTPYYTTKAALLAGISGGTTPALDPVLNAGGISDKTITLKNTVNDKRKLIFNPNTVNGPAMQIWDDDGAGNSVLHAQFTSYALQMIGSIFEAISNGGTPQDIKNATKALLPNSLKGPFEENFNREGDGLINKKAQLERERSDKDWMKRGTLGLYSPEEVKDRTLGYENNTIKAAHMKRRTQIMEDLKYRYRQGALSDEFFSKKIEQYIKFGGDPSTIASTLEKDYAESRGKTTRMRQAGTPSGITSTHDYLLMEDMRP